MKKESESLKYRNPEAFIFPCIGKCFIPKADILPGIVEGP